MKTITVNISEANETRLQRLSLARDTSLEATATDLLSRALDDPLIHLQEQVSELRRDLATATHALLIANDIPPKDAEEFVRKELFG